MKKAIKWIVAGAAIAGAGAYVVNRIISKKRKEEAEMFHACHCGGDCKCGGDHEHECECGCEDHACECSCHDDEEPRVDVDAMPAEEVPAEEIPAEDIVEEDTTPVE